MEFESKTVGEQRAEKHHGCCLVVASAEVVKELRRLSLLS
jgi:hypothetical protein